MAMWHIYSVSVDTHILVDFAFSILCVLSNSVRLLKANYKAAVCSLVESSLALCYVDTVFPEALLKCLRRSYNKRKDSLC